METIKSILRDLYTSKIVKLWMSRSFKLLLGTFAYNLFVLLLIQPLLKKWFPPLSRWEHIKESVTGSSRMTYSDLVPYVGTTIWILGNGLWITLLSREFRSTRDTLAEGGTITQFPSQESSKK